MHVSHEEFRQSQLDYRTQYASDPTLMSASMDFYKRAAQVNYTYTWNWLGLPVIQFPNDLLLMQQLIWNVRPDYIVETGVARGGSLVFYASLLKLIGGKKVVGVDIDIREDNRLQIENHVFSDFISLVEGDSSKPSTFKEVETLIKNGDKVLVVLDSGHTYSHVMRELELWGKLVSPGSYCVVFDTTCNLLDERDFESLTPYAESDWSSARNPGSAVADFASENPEFLLDESFAQQAMITNCWGGFLRRSG